MSEDGGNAGYATVDIYTAHDLVNESRAAEEHDLDPCLIDVVSVDGHVVTVTATRKYRPRVARHCEFNQNCCLEYEVKSVGRMEFSPQVQTVSFPAVVDAATDGGVDGIEILD